MVAAHSPMSRSRSLIAGRTGSRIRCVVSMLIALSQAIAAQTTPATPATRVAVDFSHVAVPLDPATFTAIATSAFLRTEFGGFEERLAYQTSSDTNYFYYGRDSFLEFLNSPGRMPVGSATLAFVVRRPGDLHVAIDALLAQRPRVIAYSLNFRQLGAESVANFFRASIRPAVQRPEQRRSGPSTTLRTDIVERVPEFLRQFDSTFPPDSVGVTNVAYLSRRWKPSGYLRSVTGVTVAADSTDTIELAGDLSALGYDVRQAADTIIATRRGFALSLLPATTSLRGVLAVRLATARRKEGQTVYRFGPRSILRFVNDSTAYWTF